MPRAVKKAPKKIRWTKPIKCPKKEDLISIDDDELDEEAGKLLSSQGDDYYNQRDYVRAKEQYELSAKKGNINALTKLGVLHVDMFGTYNDNIAAKKYFELAASKGDHIALHHIGNLYEHKNDIKAMEYYKLAAEKGYAPALDAIGQLYEYHRDMDKYKKAGEYYKKAALLGNAHAIYRLTYFYRYKYLREAKEKVVEFYLQINRPEELKQIYGYNDYDIEMIVGYHSLAQENTKLAQENTKLRAHIDASPDGKLFFEAMADWNSNVPVI